MNTSSSAGIPRSDAPRFEPRDLTPAPDALAGRVVALTGATGGIGAALAEACARHGAEVVLIGRNLRKLEALQSRLETLQRLDGGPVVAPLIAQLDLEKGTAADYDRLAAAIQGRWGRLDGLVHLAAILGVLSPIDHHDVPTFVRTLHVNVTAPFALTQVLLPSLRASPDASIVFAASGVGRRGRAYWGGYAVSKFAVEGLSQVLADELDRTTVRVNTLNPGPVRTALRRQAYPAEDLQRLPEPAAVVAPFVVLLSAAARGVTGGSFDVQPPRG